MKRYSVFSFLVCTALFLLGYQVSSFGADDTNIVIGLNVPLTGAYSEQGIDELKAYKLAIDDINADGGILGKSVVFVEKDTETNAKVAASNARMLIDDYNVQMITGGSSSAVALAQGVVAKEKGIVFMAALTHSNATTGFKIDPKTGKRKEQAVNRYMFRWYNNAWMSAHALANYLLNKFGKDATYYYITADYTWGYSVEKSFRDVLEPAGCKTIGVVRTPLGEKSYIKYLLEVKKAKPDVLVLIHFGKDMVNSLKQATALGLKKDTKIVVPLIELHMAKGAGATAMEGVICTSPWYWKLADKYPGSKKFVDKFKERFGTIPGNAAASAWVAIHEYANAVKEANSFDTKKVIKALEGRRFTLLKGEEYWRQWDHQAITSTLILEGKKASEMSSEDDALKIIDEVSGDKVARTKKDNPVKWEVNLR